jgi:hypothetical protein
MLNVYSILLRKPSGKMPLGILGCRSVDGTEWMGTVYMMVCEGARGIPLEPNGVQHTLCEHEYEPLGSTNGWELFYPRGNTSAFAVNEISGHRIAQAPQLL